MFWITIKYCHICWEKQWINTGNSLEKSFWVVSGLFQSTLLVYSWSRHLFVPKGWKKIDTIIDFFSKAKVCRKVHWGFASHLFTVCFFCHYFIKYLSFVNEVSLKYIRKIITGITGLWQPSVRSDVPFWSFDIGFSYQFKKFKFLLKIFLWRNVEYFLYSWLFSCR